MSAICLNEYVFKYLDCYSDKALYTKTVNSEKARGVAEIVSLGLNVYYCRSTHTAGIKVP